MRILRELREYDTLRRDKIEEVRRLI